MSGSSMPYHWRLNTAICHEINGNLDSDDN